MMFSDSISFSCPRGTKTARGTISCDIIDDGFGSPLSDLSLSSNVREITVFFRARAMKECLGELFKIGDRFETNDGKVFAVFAVSEFNTSVISARARQV